MTKECRSPAAEVLGRAILKIYLKVLKIMKEP